MNPPKLTPLIPTPIERAKLSKLESLRQLIDGLVRKEQELMDAAMPDVQIRIIVEMKESRDRVREFIRSNLIANANNLTAKAINKFLIKTIGQIDEREAKYRKILLDAGIGEY